MPSFLVRRSLLFRLGAFGTAMFFSGCSPSTNSRRVRADLTPQLVVLIVVDQLRGDELETYRTLWKHGLRRLTDEGRWYSQAFHGHARTETAAGHASISTGLHPRWHGVVDKLMYHRSSHSPIGVCDYGPGPCDPAVLLESTLGDRLKAARPEAKVVAISRKARSAMLLGGHRADLVAWFEASPLQLQGRTHGRPGVPTWLHATFRHAVSADQRLKVWELPPIPSPFADRIDNRPSEIDRGHGIVFPHRLESPDAKSPSPAWFFTPDVDRVVQELSQRAAAKLRLGQDATPDLLLISLSAVDYIGHTFGPQSLERVASLIALDKTLGLLLQSIESWAPNRSLIALTADHGVAPTVEQAKKNGHPSGRIKTAALVQILETALEDRFGTGPFVAAVLPPFVHLRSELPAPRQAVLSVATQALSDHPGIYGAWRTSTLGLDARSEPIAKLLEENAHPVRSGEIAFAFQPYFSLHSTFYGDRGASHGTPWPYDRHVPLLLWGTGIKPARIQTPVRVIDLTRTLADRLGLQPDPRGGTPLP